MVSRIKKSAVVPIKAAHTEFVSKNEKKEIEELKKKLNKTG